jgi:hypothetical protein
MAPGLHPPLSVELDVAEPLAEERFEVRARELDAMEGVLRLAARPVDARRRHEQRPFGPEHTSGLAQEPPLIVHVLDRLECADKVEGVVRERQGENVPLDELDVRPRVLASCVGQRVGRPVDADNLARCRGQVRRPVADTARGVQHLRGFAPPAGKLVTLQVEGQDPRRRPRRLDSLGIAHFLAKYPLLDVAPVQRRLPLERAIVIAVPVTILAIACSSSWSTGLQDIGRPLRAIGLAALVALSMAYARASLRSGRLDRAVAGIAVTFVAIAALSTAWSVEPRHTLAKAIAFGLVLLIAAAVAIGAAGDAEAARRLFWSLLAGAVLVALAGLVVAVASPHDSVQAATRSVGRRYRGIGVNPNTTAMLFAVALPLAVAVWLDARSRRERGLASGAFLLLAGSVVAAGSRGAAAAAVVGLLVLAVAHGCRALPRAVAAGVAVALAVTAILVTAVSAPLSAAEAARAKTLVGNTERYTPNDAEYIVRLTDELGSGGSGSSRNVFDTSGRVEAWRGALRQGDDRPLLGYGFGTEKAVFVDRYRAFEGGVPENSFIGLFLQLGAVGLALFVALLVALTVVAVRFARAGDRTGALALAVLAAAIVLAAVQSYVYAVGNVATLAFWMCAFLPAATRLRE